jgi:hypothetical protein
MTPDTDRLTVSLPWPVRLYGDFQDALGLPCISAAIDVRTAIRARPREDAAFTISGHGLDETIRLDSGAVGHADSVPSLVRALEVVRSQKFALKRGYDFEIVTRVPGIENFPASPILTATWVATLTYLSESMKDVSGMDLAQLAWEAVRTMDDSWHWPETVVAILGGARYFEDSGEGLSESLGRDLPGMVLGWVDDAPLASPRRFADDAVAAREALEDIMGEGALISEPFDAIAAQLQDLSPDHAQVIYAHLMLREQCASARAVLGNEGLIDDDVPAELMDGGHEILRDYFGCSSEPIEKLIDAAADGGALGCKFCVDANRFLAYSPNSADKVVEAIIAAGGQARPAPIEDGVRVETGLTGTAID